jgi:serine/threonine protein phosphatase 1
MSLNSFSQRSIIIGDVHGCYEELDSLLNNMSYNPVKDKLFFIGDLINKGPSSKEVFLRFKKWNAKTVVGNHELHFLKHLKKGKPYKSWVKKIIHDFGDLLDDFVADSKQWPLFLEEKDFILVHGGLIPNQSLEESKKDSRLVSIRTWDGIGKNLNNQNIDPPWFDFYSNQKLVVFGHWAELGVIKKDNVIGLDSGCVYGKQLTGLSLPDRTFYSVPAKEEYCPIV